MLESVISVTDIEESLISPERETPKHDLYLSELDFLVRFHIPRVHVYEAESELGEIRNPAKALKNALAKVLVNYYPLGGRLKQVSESEGTVVVNCNGEGVLFAEAKANCALKDVCFLNELYAPTKDSALFSHLDQSHPIEKTPLLYIQVTVFTCGGFTLGVRIPHIIMDGEGFSKFMTAFALVAKHGESALSSLPPPVWERERLSPRRPPQFNENLHAKRIPTEEFMERRRSRKQVIFTTFHCSQDFIARLKDKVIQESQGELAYCSSFEALTAIIWKTYAATMEFHKDVMGFRFSVSTRKVFRSVISQEGYYGNCVAIARVEEEDLICGKNNVLSMWDVVRAIRKVKDRVNNEVYMRSMIDYLDSIGNRKKNLHAGDLLSDKMFFNDRSKFAYLPDFGIGKGLSVAVPVENWVFPCAMFNPKVRDQVHLSLLIGLPEETMPIFKARFLALMDME